MIRLDGDGVNFSVLWGGCLVGSVSVVLFVVVGVLFGVCSSILLVVVSAVGSPEVREVLLWSGVLGSLLCCFFLPLVVVASFAHVLIVDIS